MQNQFVLTAGKSFVGHYFSGSIVKGFGLQQQRNALPRLTNDQQTQNYSVKRFSGPLLLPGGGLGKLQGSFKEEQYFNVHDHMLVAQLQKTGYRLKCESLSNANWKEFERMANDLTKIAAVRQSGQLCKYKNSTEESFFLQEQRSLLERIIDALRRLFANRGGMPMPPPYGGGFYPYGPQYYHKGEEKKNEEGEKENEAQSNEEENLEKNENETNDEEKQEEENSTQADEKTEDFQDPHDGRGDEEGGKGRE